MIDVLEFTLRGGADAARAARRVARTTSRYLGEACANDVAAVVSECVSWLAAEGEPHPLRLELSATSSIVRVAITEPRRSARAEALTSRADLQQKLPLTAELASRYGVETNGRLRIWAEFDRPLRERPPLHERL